MVDAAIALGIAIGLVLAPLIGFTAAGLVVPGYLALHFASFERIVATFAVALATWAVVELGVSRLVILYGRRRLGVTVLTGFALTAALNLVWHPFAAGGADLRVIGHIVPGLIANEALHQGVVPTFAMTLLVASLTRVALLLLFAWAP
jgi:poly-gamma-glutamate biosynthesis protein PgsC/CapC